MRRLSQSLSTWMGVLLCCACSDPEAIPQTKLSVEVVAPETALRFGQSFELRLILRHAKALRPDPFDFRQFDPLVIEEVARETRADAQTIEQSIELKAHAFALDRVRLEALQWVARDPATGAMFSAHSSAREWEIHSNLPAEDALLAEIPFAPRPDKALWPWLIAAVLSVLGATWFLRRRRHVKPVTIALPEPSPSKDAQQRLREAFHALRSEIPDAERDRVLAAIFASTLAQRVREAIGLRHQIDARVRTRTELASDPRWLTRASPSDRAACDRILGLCERAQFARAGFPAGELARLVDAAEALLIEEPHA